MIPNTNMARIPVVHYRCPRCDTEWDDRAGVALADMCPGCLLRGVKPLRVEKTVIYL